MQFLFVDSNLFLQCRPLQDLDWDRLVGREDVTILVPSAVLAELDKHKSDGNGRRAQRARGALKFLDSLLEAPDDTVVLRTTPNKVCAQFAPEVSEAANTSNDDSILFEVAEMARVHGNDAVSLVTHDTNLKVKAKRKRLRFFAVPEEWLLAPEPDERDKRLKKLEEEVSLLKRQTPIIEISVEGSQDIEIVVPNYEPLASDTVERLVGAMKAKFPMKTNFSPTSIERALSVNVLGILQPFPPTDHEIAQYQEDEYPKWEQALRHRLERLHTSLRLRETTANVRSLIANTGTVPGEHVHINIKVSDGFFIATAGNHDELTKELLARPSAPNPPQPRRSLLDSFGKLHPHSGLGPSLFPKTAEHPSRDEFYRKTGKHIDTEWIWACVNMRHGLSPQEFLFRVGVNAQSKPSGGQLVFEVSAENLPKAAVKALPINIVYVPADIERAAEEWLEICSD